MAQTIIVDTTPGYRMPTIYYSQGDIGRTFSIDLQSRFGESLPASPTITIQATKPSGLGFSVASTSISGAVVTFTVTETMSNEAGRFPAELKIVKNSVTLFTANFYIDCEANAHPEGTTDGDIDHIMPKFMSVTTTTLPAGDSATYSFDADTNTATFGIPKGADGSLASQVLAADYSSSKTYAVGDYVYYSGNLYRCTTAITTAEAWTSGHWTQVALANDVSDVKSDLTKITGNEKIKIEQTSRYIDLSGSSVTMSGGEPVNSGYSASYSYCVVPCSEGDKFTINGTGGGQTRLWGFISSDGTILEKADSNATATDLVIKAPTNSAFLIVHGKTAEWKESYIGELVDISISELNAKTAELSEDVDKIYSEIYNLVDSSDFVNGKYAKGAVGTEIEFGDNSAYSYVSFPVEGNTDYTITAWEFYIKLVDVNNEIVQSIGWGTETVYQNYTFTTDADAVYAYVDIKSANTSFDTYMAVKGDALPSEYVNKGHPIVLTTDFVDAVANGNNGKVYFVGATRENTSLMDLLTALSGDPSKKVIYIDAGTYDIFDEIGGSEFALSIPSGTSWRDVSVFVPPNTSIIGLGHVVLQFTPTVAEIGDVAKMLLSPINVNGSIYMENIEIVAENCRYAVHDDNSATSNFPNCAEKTSKYKNVILSKSGEGNTQAFGGGCVLKQSFDFENCIFKSTGLPFSMHNNTEPSNGLKSPSIYFENCAFINNGGTEYSVRFGNINWVQTEIPVIMSNCYMNKKVYLFKETASLARQAFNLRLVKCSPVTIDEDTMTANIFTPQIYN